MLFSFDSNTVLETERLLLEPLQRKHAIALYPILQDERIYRYIPQEPPTSLEALQQRYQKLETRSSPDGTETWLNWAVYIKERQTYAGYVEVTVLPNCSAQIAYLFSPLFWHQRSAYEACQYLVVNLWQNYDITEIVAEVDTRNTPSIMLLQRLGFVRVDTRKNADFFQGSYSDEYIYRLSNLTR